MWPSLTLDHGSWVTSKQEGTELILASDPPRVKAFRPSAFALPACFRLHFPFVPERQMKKPLLPIIIIIIALTFTTAAQTEKPLTSFPYTPGLDVTRSEEHTPE